MIQVTIREAKTHLSKLIEQAVEGEEVIIAKANKPMVKRVPILQFEPKRKIATAKGTLKIADDFDSPVDDFTEYRI